VLTFSGPAALADAFPRVWPNGTPGGIVTASISPTEVKLAELSWDPLQ
jgi:hypothetical protein